MGDELPRSTAAGRVIEWDNAAADYAAHRAPFPDLLVDLLRPLGVGGPGQHVVDLATGVGTPALEFARGGSRVTGVDSSAGMLAEAARRAREESLPLTTVHAPAEETGLPDACADAVTVGQAWHWFDAPRAAREVARLLVPGGNAAICALDWLVGADALVDATFDVLRRHNPDVVARRPLESVDRRDEWLTDLGGAGLDRRASMEVVTPLAYTAESWRGRLRASTWVDATLAPSAVVDADAELREVLREAPPTFAVPHVIFVAVAEKRAK